MLVNHSGWNINSGFFNYDIYVDEKRSDYELHFADGSISKQAGPFEAMTYDWNCDGDVYTLFGAWFTRYERNGDQNGRDFWTPEDMVRALIDSMDKDNSSYGDRIVSIPGIKIPVPEKRPSLDDTIRQSEQRSMAQDIERNRRMNALGIRPSNEPWAR